MDDIVTQMKYIELLAPSLKGFRQVKYGLYNFRCPICGDSSYDEHKRRGYLVQKDLKYFFYCHNCGESYTFNKFLKTVDPELYGLYKRETFKNSIVQFKTLSKEEVVFKNYKPKIYNFKKDENNDLQTANKNESKKILKYLIPCNLLNEKHTAVQYLLNRKLSKNKLKYVYYTDNYFGLVNDFFPNKYEEKNLINEGIVFVLKDLNENITGFQIRNLNLNCSKKDRFKTCSQDNSEHYFIKEKLDISKPIFVVEGCIDSLFLNNSIAILNSALCRFKMDNVIYINDCEPRNSAIVNEIKKCCNSNYKTCLLPIEYEGCDINDIIKLGVSEEELEKIILKNSFSGLNAKINFAKWTK